MQLVPVYDRYSFQIRRSRMIAYSMIGIFLFGFGCGLGLYVASDVRMVHIIELSERNRILIDALKNDARDMQRTSAMMAQRCGVITIEDENR